MKKTEYTPKRKWRIECTEEKLRLMASMVEDVTRFIGGQPQLMSCLMMFDNGNKIGEYMRENVRPVDELEPETMDYWTATNPDGRQFTFRSKPVRRQWANQWTWEPSARGYYIGEEATKVLIEVLGLPKLTWDDEPCKFTILKPKRDDQD